MSARLPSLVRWRAGLAVAAVVVPLGLRALFERQARRLDALAHHGAPVAARVAAVSRDGGGTYYAYRVDGVDYDWNVKRADAPYPVGEVFTATYLPEVPSFSRPTADRALAAREAEHNRQFATRLILGVAATLGLFAFLLHRDIRKLRTNAPSEASDPARYRRRLATTALVLVPGLAVITSFHVRDAMSRGQSVAPAILGLAIAVATIGSVFFFAMREGPARAGERAARVLRWVAPIAIAVAVLRVLVAVVANSGAH